MQPLNYSGQESKALLAAYDDDTAVTLKHGQGHQTWYEVVDPKQGLNHAKFKKTSLQQCW